MNCLWLTLADPDPPHDGQFVYSGGLIRAVGRKGAEIVVLGLGRAGAKKRDGDREGRIVWRLGPHQPLTHWASLPATLPHMANRCRTAEMRVILGQLLAEKRWEAIVFDSLSTGWALSTVLARYRDQRVRPHLVYVSHNHEESLRRKMVGSHMGWLKREAQRLDVLKVARLERALVEAADLVTAITPEDGALYRAQWPDKMIEILPPGYAGRVVPQRQITADIPRRAVIVGSFDWIAKRINLEEFVHRADPIFAAEGIELQVVGSGEQSYFDQLQHRLSATRFTGTVAQVETYLDGARVAVVPERNGGGFKLKVLEYVFNRMPVFALKNSVAGVPLRDEESILLFSDHAALARGVARLIDDLDRLNQLQNAAYDACREAFDWDSRGQQLLTAVDDL